MAGILDNKARVMDVILTLEGRSQLASGGPSVKYASFSDASVYYAPDVVSGSSDASVRIAFEACNLPQDQVMFQADGSGHVLPFGNADSIQLVSGKVIDYSLTYVTGNLMSGSVQSSTSLHGDDFSSSVDALLASTVGNFGRLRTLNTFDDLFDDDGFGVGGSDVTFTLTENGPLLDPSAYSADVNHLEGIYSDVRLSHLQNTMFLPPLNRVPEGSPIDRTNTSQTTTYQLGDYAPWGTVMPGGLSKEQLDLELQHYEALHSVRSVSFDPTSSNNRLVAQAFEVSSDTLKKLDIIEHPVANTTKRYFFVGKTVQNDAGVDVFVHLFTMVFG